MPNSLKKMLRVVLKIFLSIVAFILLYGIAVFLLSKITVNSSDKDSAEDIAIYIKTNGVHTDVILPIKSEILDWSKTIRLEDTASKDTAMQYIAFGWGDRE